MNRAQPERAIRFTATPSAPHAAPHPAPAAIQAERVRLAQARRTAKAARQARGASHAP